MADMRITEHGVEIPILGQMSVTVKMSEDMFSEFLQYRKDREELSQKIYRTQATAQRYAQEICSTVLDALNVQENGQIVVVNKEALEKAYSLAVDWLC